MKNILMLLFIFNSALFLLFIFFSSRGYFINMPNNSDRVLGLEVYADRVIDVCKNDSHRPSCYDEEIPKLMDFISMEDTFNVTKIIQGIDKSYVYCHVLGHKLSARELKKDPSKWKEIVARSPKGVCSNGAIHGVLQEKFRSETLNDEQIKGLLPDLADVCEKRDSWHPTGMEQASCYHAIGHLSMYITSADISKSLGVCEKVALKEKGRDFTQVCFDGAFMQIYQPLEPEDFALIEGKQPREQDVLSFCKTFLEKPRVSCWNESWPLSREEILTSTGLVDFCSSEIFGNSAARDRCFEAMFFVATAQFNFNDLKISSLCLGLPEGLIGKCFGIAATRLIETDYRNINKAVNLCTEAKDLIYSDICYSTLAQRSKFNFGSESPNLNKICSSLPQEWINQCLSGTR